MAMGVYCDSCKHKELEHKFDKWPCMDCCDGDRRDPVRNADRIRAMTDEELAGWLCDIAGWLPMYEGKMHPILDWLKEEATQNDS